MEPPPAHFQSTANAQSESETTVEQAAKREAQAQETPVYGGEYLNSRGYDLYAEFRPSTSGEWGKKGRLWYDKILALRRGCESDMLAWKDKEAQLEKDGPPEEDWSEDVERLVQEELEREQREADVHKQEQVDVKAEGAP